MSVLHIGNTFFEQELEATVVLGMTKSLTDWVRSHPMLLQLQFLPLLYADPNDLILVSDLPTDPDVRLRLLNQRFKEGKIVHWGPSLAISAWAKKQGLSYVIPEWEVVQMVNSKIFSYTKSPKLVGSALLANEEEVKLWIDKTPNHKVLKTAFGTAGSGHFHVGGKRDLSSYLRRQFSKDLPVIGEPWVDRVFDFSTQWVVSKEKIECLGATIFENRPSGSYLATFAGKPFSQYEWALEEHLSVAQPLMREIVEMGFFGNLGVDAFVYQEGGREKLHPVVEINGRKTMSWVALTLQQKQFPNQILRFSFEKGETGLLPQKLFVGEKERIFTHQIGQKLYLSYTAPR